LKYQYGPVYFQSHVKVIGGKGNMLYCPRLHLYCQATSQRYGI